MSLLANRMMLNKATANNEKPTAGYIYGEISKLSYTSCRQLEDYLDSKLMKEDKAYTKLKTLKIIQHLCQNGNPEFRRNMQRKTNGVRNCLQFRGKPDPLKGEEPSRKVRALAQEVMAVIFDNDVQQQTSSRPMEGFGSAGTGAVGSGGPGMGTHSAAAAAAGETTSASGMTGFGNPAFNQVAPQAQEKQSVFSKVKTAVTQQVQQRRGPGGSWGTAPSGAGGGVNGGGIGGLDKYEAGFRAPPVSTGPAVHIEAQEAGEYEGKLVDAITTPAGVRVRPSRDQLRDFTKKARSLDATVLGELLEDKLEDDNKTVRMRTLYVVEDLVKNNVLGIVAHFDGDAGESIEALCESAVQAERALAEKVLDAIDSKADAADAAAAKSSSPPPMAVVPNARAPPVPGSPAQPQKQAAPAVTPQKQEQSAFDFLSSNISSPAAAPTPAPASGGGGGGGDLFSGMSLSSPSKAAPAPVAATAAPVAAAAPVASPGRARARSRGRAGRRRGGSNAAAAAAAAPSGDLLGVEEPAAPTDAAAAAAGGATSLESDLADLSFDPLSGGGAGGAAGGLSSIQAAMAQQQAQQQAQQAQMQQQMQQQMMMQMMQQGGMMGGMMGGMPGGMPQPGMMMGGMGGMMPQPGAAPRRTSFGQGTPPMQQPRSRGPSFAAAGMAVMAATSAAAPVGGGAGMPMTGGGGGGGAAPGAFGFITAEEEAKEDPFAFVTASMK